MNPNNCFFLNQVFSLENLLSQPNLSYKSSHKSSHKLSLEKSPCSCLLLSQVVTQRGGEMCFFLESFTNYLSLPINFTHITVSHDSCCSFGRITCVFGSHQPFIFQHRVLMKRLKKQCKSGCQSAHGSIPRSFGNIDLLQWHLFSHILFSDIFDLRALTNNMAAKFRKLCKDGDLEGVQFV